MHTHRHTHTAMINQYFESSFKAAEIMPKKSTVSNRHRNFIIIFDADNGWRLDVASMLRHFLWCISDRTVFNYLNSVFVCVQFWRILVKVCVAFLKSLVDHNLVHEEKPSHNGTLNDFES
uniref:Uncharacterized protein n=1 Tax=Anguilla anguilla TaxID=7936 RepID=A0A0E9X212_ANGAN